MFEHSFDHEERSPFQGRRPSYAAHDRRSSSRGYPLDDERGENHDRTRHRYPESERRYTRPDYDSDLEIERPGQPHFASRYGADYSRESDRDAGWQRPYRSQRYQDRYEGYRRADYGAFGGDYGRGSDYGRGASDWGRGMGDYGRGMPDSGRDWQASGIGHADWDRYSNYEQGWGRRGYEQQPHFNEQRSRWPKSYKRSDERLKDDIHEELIRHGRIDASDIEVAVKDGEVTLTGQVVSRQDKRLAEELAERVLGVHDVQNHLRVRGSNQAAGSEQPSGSAAMGRGSMPAGPGASSDQANKANASTTH